jgi:hypothetical protein
LMVNVDSRSLAAISYLLHQLFEVLRTTTCQRNHCRLQNDRFGYDPAVDTISGKSYFIPQERQRIPRGLQMSFRAEKGRIVSLLTIESYYWVIASSPTKDWLLRATSRNATRAFGPPMSSNVSAATACNALN